MVFIGEESRYQQRHEQFSQAAFGPGSIKAGTHAKQLVGHKTRMCKFFITGACSRGASCVFAHQDDELQHQPDLYRTRLCNSYWRSGFCKNGNDCCYAHGKNNLRRNQRTDRYASSMKLGSEPRAVGVLDPQVFSDQQHGKTRTVVTQAATLWWQRVAMTEGLIRQCMRGGNGVVPESLVSPPAYASWQKAVLHDTCSKTSFDDSSTYLGESLVLSRQCTDDPYSDCGGNDNILAKKDEQFVVQESFLEVQTVDAMAPLSWNHATYGLDFRVSKTFLEFGAREAGPTLRRISSSPGSLLTIR